MSGIARWIMVAACFACVAPTCADWANVDYSYGEGEPNTVVGPGQGYESARPETGPWTACYTLRNHSATLGGEKIRIFSAHTVTFRDHGATSGHSGKSSHVVLKIRLSEPVSAFRWDIGIHGRDVTAGSVLAARYSVDGEKWTDACVYLAGQQVFDPPAVDLRLDAPTDEVYIGWFAEVPEGGRGWWDMGNTGTLTFTSVRQAVRGDAQPEADTPAYASLQGPRFIPNSFFGTTTHVNGDPGIKLLKDLKIPNVRIDFLWLGLEPARGEYRFPPDFWIIRSADLGVEHGLDQLPVITRAPEWALAGNGTFPNDDSVAALEECMYQIATKYKGKIKHWQAMNEPNMAVWRDRYIAFLKAFHDGVKRADPENKVVLCGFAGVEDMHLDAAYRLGGKDYFDVIASHSYTRPAPPEEGGYLRKIKALHDVMTKYGDEKPLWVTEMGWNGVEPSMLEYLRAKYPGHRTYAVTEEDQARGLARLYLLSATVPWIERVYFFHLHQESPYTEVTEQVDYYTGLFSPWLEENVRPKDAYFAVKTVIEVLNEATYKEQLDLGARMWGLVFERGDEATIALWSLDDGVTMTLGDASAIQSVTSMVGTPVLVRENQLPLSGRPIYVKARATDVARLRAEIERAEVSGAQRFQLALGLDGESTKPDRPFVAVEITNAGRQAATPPPVHLQVHSPLWKPSEDRIASDEPLPPGGKRAHSVALTGVRPGDSEVACRVSARLFDGETQTRAERTIRYLVAGAAPRGFVADGALGEWRDHRPIEIGNTPDQREFAGWGGRDDCAAQWYCASDGRALYFAAEVTDNVHHQPVDAAAADTMWRSDSIQIAFDVAGDAQPVSNVPQYDGENDVEIGLALSLDGPMAYAWVNPKGETGLLAVEGFAVVRDEAAQATRYEIAIPWPQLGLAEAPVGRWMGMNVLVNDNDGEGRRGWLEWAPGIGYTKDPSQFPRVLMTWRGPR